MNDKINEIVRLAALVSDDTISSDEIANLSELLIDDSAAQRCYLHHLKLDAALSWRASPQSLSATFDLLHDQPLPTLLLHDPRPRLSRLVRALGRRSVNSPIAATLLVAAVLYGVFGFLAWDLRSTIFSGKSWLRDVPVALISSTAEVRWASEVAKTLDDPSIQLGEPLKIDSGVVELELKRGARVVVVGPAEWSVDTDNLVTLKAGRLVAQVSLEAVGFTVKTPTANIVDLGTEFGVAVSPDSATEVHVLRGQVEVYQVSKPQVGTKVTVGEAIRVSADSKQAVRIPVDARQFDRAQFPGSVASTKPNSSAAFEKVTTIPLGNLFDDPRGTPLAKAIESDEFRAVAEVGDLAIYRVFYGGDAAKQINPHVLFNARTLGWNGARHTSITNDAWCESADFGEEDGTPGGGGIQTLGTRIKSNAPKIEDGIGMHANALITFDLEKIRSAGKFDGHKLEFICDRAGINDNRVGKDRGASVHMAVLLSDAVRVRSALVDGQDSQLTEKAGIWSVAAPLGKSLRADGRFCSFRIVISPDVRYLTLLATCADEDYFADHAVWSGARLEVK